jgi:CTP:molybdopterin cytidylyltransferase MocA
VLGHDAARIRPFVPTSHTVRVVENPAYVEGRTSSLRQGFAVVGGHPAGILVVAVDQPIAPGTVKALLHAVRPEAAIAQPAFQGKRGHPVLFRGDLLAELRAIEEASKGLRAVVARHRELRQEVLVIDPDVLLDLNEPADYEGRLATGTGPL